MERCHHHAYVISQRRTDTSKSGLPSGLSNNRRLVRRRHCPRHPHHFQKCIDLLVITCTLRLALSLSVLAKTQPKPWSESSKEIDDVVNTNNSDEEEEVEKGKACKGNESVERAIDKEVAKDDDDGDDSTMSMDMEDYNNDREYGLQHDKECDDETNENESTLMRPIGELKDDLAAQKA